MQRHLIFCLVAAVVFLAMPRAPMTAQDTQPIVVNDDGGWCWFQDERAVIHAGKLFVGSVANGALDASRKGDIDVAQIDLQTGEVARHTLYHALEDDDHDVPALWVRPSGGLLAAFSKHGSENHFYYRTLSPDAPRWGPLKQFSPSPSSRVTYANLLFLSAENDNRGRLYNFYRGLDGSFKPSFAWSDNQGESWTSGNVVIDVPSAFRHRPYVKYASNDRDTIHFFYTDGHPRNFDNSIYHVFYRRGMLHRSDGTPIRALSEGLQKPEEGTCLFRGDAKNVGWVSDAQLSEAGHPYVVFSVQKDSADLKSGDEAAGQDHRYHYARWDGDRWHEHEVCFGGTRLYAGEDDYTGNLCLHPTRLDTVFISTNADPTSGTPLVSAADKRRHHELFRGATADGGEHWQWQALTSNSTADNLRPIVPKWTPGSTALLWLRGDYHTYRNYHTQVLLQKLRE